MNNELSSYDNKINYIGKWTSNIDANANIYYVIVNNQIRKIIFSKPIEPTSMQDTFGIIYIIEDDGNMVYCQPDEMIFYLIIYQKQKNILKNKRNYLIL